MYQTARSDMEQLGTERDFRDMVRQPFLAFLIINLFYWLFYYALHLFDKGLIVTELNIELNNLKAQLEAGLGDPQQGNIFRERIAELEKAIQSPPGQPLGPVITRMLMGALGGFGLAAAIVALVRTKK
ncbi:MAG: hypothetical protein JNJ57_08955 [Saprospiraceae bacterium]|nr:hypothetical protein [Saprospiraceae bacterium]